MTKDIENNNGLVEILLATYNGEKYITEQINSIRAQSYKNWILSINDDGSTDTTMAIVKSAANNEPRINLKSLSNNRYGAAGNFLALLADSSASYIMFCDQDDIWYPNKIALEMDAIRTAEALYGTDVPLLVFTDSSIVDKELKVINPSRSSTVPFKPDNVSLAQLIISNVAQGCSILINRPLVKKMLLYPLPDVFVMHDYWAIVLAAIFGKVKYLPISTLSYRQHESNVWGASKNTLTAKDGLMHVLKEPAILRGWFSKLSHDEKDFIPRAQKVLEMFSDQLSDADCIMLERISRFEKARRTEKYSTIRDYKLIKNNQRSTYSKLCQFLGMML